MEGEKIFKARTELRQMAKTHLLKIAFSQKEKNCVLGGVCPFLLEYQYILFCVTGIQGQGCQVGKLKLHSDENTRSEDGTSTKAVKLAIRPRLPGLG